jgi:NADH-quinone oxidoreductase subunit J
MEIAELFFYFFSLVVLGIGCVVAFSKNLLRSAFALFFVLFGIAGFYILLGGDFVAVTQIMVYAGGVNVLLIFGTMLTADVSHPTDSNPSFQVVFTLVGGALIFCLLFGITMTTQWGTRIHGEMVPTTRSLGTLLLKEYILPFEVISFLLVSAMVGALFLVNKGEQ